MDEHDKGQVIASAAALYEQFFVPALFADWPKQLLVQAQVKAGQHVLDIACGTGTLSQEAEKRVGPSGEVNAIDINAGMLAIASGKSSSIRWQQGNAEKLAFSDHRFDRVLCQFGLMFFQDKHAAAAEMRRVLKPGGLGCVSVWAPLAATPGYAAVADMLRQLFGPEIAKSVEAPYCLGNQDALKRLFTEAGARDIRITTLPGKAHFESIDSWIYTDIKAWTLADVINDEDFEKLRHVARQRLAAFVVENGRVEFETPAHVVTFSG